MELKDVASTVINTAGSIAARTVGGKVEKYYPVLFQIVDTVQDKRVTYYLEDIRAWADGDIGGIAGMERHVIMGLAQGMLNDLVRIEATSPPPEGARRIERREDSENQL